MGEMICLCPLWVGELFSLKTADYHETYVIGGEKTEAGRDRVIPIKPEGRPYFEHFAKKATGEQFLSGYDGEHIAANYRKRAYYPLLKRLGIDKAKTPHTARHTYTSMAVKAGMQPEILQKILGHASYETTANIYTHIDIDTLVKAVEM